MDEVSIEIDIEKTDINKIDIEKLYKPHNGKLIHHIIISPDHKYVCTYSEEDESIVGWNVEDIEEGRLKLDDTVQPITKINFQYIYLTDDKKIFYFTKNKNEKVKAFDMKINQEIGTPPNIPRSFCLYKSDHIYFADDKTIYIYSTKLKNNEYICKSIYYLPDRLDDDIELELTVGCPIYIVKVTKNDILYFVCDKYLYGTSLHNEKSFRINMNDEVCNILEDEDFIYIITFKYIMIYSIEFEVIIANLDKENGINYHIEIYQFMKRTNSYNSLLTLIFYYIPHSGIWKPMLEHCWKKCIDRLKENNQLPEGYQPESLPDRMIIRNNYGYGLLDNYIWKFKVDLTDFSLDHSFFDDVEFNTKNMKMIDNVSVTLFDREMNIIHSIFQNELSLNSNEFIRWDLEIFPGAILLKVFKKVKIENEWEWNFICERMDKHLYISPFMHRILSSSLFSNGDIAILTTMGFFIYHFNLYNKSISLNYFYRMKLIGGDNYVKKNTKYFRELFTKSTLPIPNYESFKLNDEWISDLINNKLDLLRYGNKLLSFAIEGHNTELIDNIYKRCLTYYNQDLFDKMCHLKFLSIITNAMPLLNEYYPEYIKRFSLDTVMIADFPNYYLKHRNVSLHLNSFIRHRKLIDYSRSIYWYEYTTSLQKLRKKRFNYYLLEIAKYLMIPLILPILPIYYALFYILSNFQFINYFKYEGLFSYVYYYITHQSKITKYFKTKKPKEHTAPTLTFVIPLVGFFNYPQDYDWFQELIKPKTSLFVEVMNRDIYKSWSGESLINFKWNAYGKYYYAIIWFMFMALFICFSAAASISLNEDTRNRLLIASIILGFIHLSFEIRQLIFNPYKWIHSFWNFFDLIAYLLPIYTSIYWLESKELNFQIIQLLSFSCLFLDIKFLLFFRAFESFGVYFAIIVSVGRQIISFLVVLLIIIMSFAHAFFILLLPRFEYSLEEITKNDDPNNPWNMSPGYNQVFDNGTIDSKPFMIQPPNENTNMFIDYRTSLFAMYLFLTGDSSALSNWSYKNNPPLAILIVLFSLLIVVYLMNLLIGLLNIAIEKDNNRVSYLMQKVEILAEIELFYLLPHQRRWQAWFPYMINYFATADKVRERIKEMFNEREWETELFPEMKQKLLDKLHIQHNPINDKVFMDKLEEIYIIVSKLSKEQSPQIEKIDEIKEIEVQPNNQK
ncbi:hypothetical protein C1646_812276 [Rhizophagus diaphanus]|nr:hypothetical protein C1646_812276 [Rhizophagus diaphanus] [Rhizophagus sp. MUCL 43196]